MIFYKLHKLQSMIPFLIECKSVWEKSSVQKRLMQSKRLSMFGICVYIFRVHLVQVKGDCFCLICFVRIKGIIIV